MTEPPRPPESESDIVDPQSSPPPLPPVGTPGLVAQLARRPRFWALPAIFLGLAGAMAGILTAGVIIGLVKQVTGEVPPPLMIGAGLIGMQLPAAAAVLYCARRFNRPEDWGAITNLRKPRLLDLPLGVLCGIGCFITSAVVGAMVQVAFRIADVEPKLQDPVTMMRDADPVMLTVLVIGAVFVAPVCEEIFFRLAIFDGIRLFGAGEWTAILITSALFASIHFSLTMGLPLFALGVVLQLARLKTGSLWVPIIGHMLFNSSTVAFIMIARLLNIEIPG